MRHFQVSSFALVSLPVFSYAVSLLDALKANGAARFASAIEANSTLLALYTAPGIRTVYGVPDTSYTGIVRRQTPTAQTLELHCSQQLTSLESLSVFPGAISSTRLISPGLSGQAQSVVTQSGLVLTPPGKHRRQSGPVTVSSGLGNKVNLGKGNIPFDGGVIHLIDGLFTLPQSVSSSIANTGLSSLSAILQQAGVLDQLTSATSITFFTPSAAALAPYLSGTDPAVLKALILNHVVPNFVGYLPLLQNGASLPTLGAKPITITIKGNAFFVNDAQIVSPNTITSNGVYHGIDKVLNAPPVPSRSANATSAAATGTRTASSGTSSGTSARGSGSSPSATGSTTPSTGGAWPVRPQGSFAVAIGLVLPLFFFAFMYGAA